MTQKTAELQCVYVGGPLSMMVTTEEIDLFDDRKLRLAKAGPAMRYVFGEIIRIPCPERRVVVFGYMDACRSIRNGVCSVVATISGLIIEYGDVEVAMFNFAESEKQPSLSLSEMEGLDRDFLETVHRLCAKSRLSQRKLVQVIIGGLHK